MGAPLSLQLELRALQALPDLVVGNAPIGRRGSARGIDKPGELPIPEHTERSRLDRVVTVAIDDHRPCASRSPRALRFMTS